MFGPRQLGRAKEDEEAKRGGGWGGGGGGGGGGRGIRDRPSSPGCFILLIPRFPQFSKSKVAAGQRIKRQNPLTLESSASCTAKHASVLSLIVLQEKTSQTRWKQKRIAEPQFWAGPITKAKAFVDGAFRRMEHSTDRYLCDYKTGHNVPQSYSSIESSSLWRWFGVMNG